MTTKDRFEELRRAAYDRGRRDFDRFREQAEPGEPPFRNNPHQNNHATDERESWDEGWDDAALDHEQERSGNY